MISTIVESIYIFQSIFNKFNYLHEYSVPFIHTDSQAGPLATVHIQVKAPNYDLARRCDCVEIPGLPEKRDQPVPDSLRIGVVALQFSPQELFLDQDPQSKHPDRNARQQSSGVRFQPQGHTDQQEDNTRIHRMSHHAVDSDIDDRLLLSS
jgi:hypothetical protein